MRYALGLHQGVVVKVVKVVQSQIDFESTVDKFPHGLEEKGRCQE